MKKKYFIQQFLGQEYMHGGVGCVDAEKVLIARGFVPIVFPHQYSFSLIAKISRFFFLLKMISTVKPGSTVVFIWPVYARMTMFLLDRLRKKKNIRLICYVADINGIKDGDEKILQEEIRFFRQFTCFIAHNEIMKKWLRENVSADATITTLEFFDFLTQPSTLKREPSTEIAFAGNLEKSIFLKDLFLLHITDPLLRFHLYGPGQMQAMIDQPNVVYHGIKTPYELPSIINGSFGLLWDGETIDKPGGNFGHYMQYISHHKLSLYILSKLPIIVPATAASAPLIAKYKIGFAINNLYEIGDKLKNLSAADYYQMQTNMQPLADKISKGGCLGEAIKGFYI